MKTLKVVKKSKIQAKNLKENHSINKRQGGITKGHCHKMPISISF